MNDITTLIARLEAATAPDRELDADVYQAIGFDVTRAAKRTMGAYRAKRTKSFCYLVGSYWHRIECVTASIDAAVSLAERVLPGWEWHRLIGREMEVYRPGSGADEEEQFFSSHHPLPAIALVIAILRAKQAKGKV